jgi:hypothetical protein
MSTRTREATLDMERQNEQRLYCQTRTTQDAGAAMASFQRQTPSYTQAYRYPSLDRPSILLRGFLINYDCLSVLDLPQLSFRVQRAPSSPANCSRSQQRHLQHGLPHFTDIATMRFSILPLLALLPLSLASNLEIDYLTPEITCERKTKNGDHVSMRKSPSQTREHVYSRAGVPLAL